MLTVIVPPGVISGGVASAQMAWYLRNHSVTSQDWLVILIIVAAVLAAVFWICKRWY